MKDDDKKVEPMSMQALKEIKLDESDKRRLAFLFFGILAALALSVLIFDTVFAHYGAQASYYPGNCNNSSLGTVQCLYSLANSTGDASICNYIEGTQGSKCVVTVAGRTGNVSACNYLYKQNPYYSTCVLGVENSTGNIAICGDLSAQLAQNCIYSALSARNFNGSAVCSRLSNTSYSAECAALVYYKNALAGPNPSDCQLLQDTLNSSVLNFMNYNGSSSVSIGNAYLYSLTVSPRDYCYFKLAIQEVNLSICNSIQGNFSTTCSYYVNAANESTVAPSINATSASAACVRYTGQDLDLCYLYYRSDLAIRFMNVSECYSLNNSLNRDLCVYRLVVNTSDFDYCPDILNLTIRSACTLYANYSST